MSKAKKSVRRASATRKTAALFQFNLTEEGRQALALAEAYSAAGRMLTDAICGKPGNTRAAVAAIHAAHDAARARIKDQAEAIVVRIAGDWANKKEHPVATRDDLLTLAILAYNGTDRDGVARRAIIRAVLAGGGLVPSKARGYSLVARRGHKRRERQPRHA